MSKSRIEAISSNYVSKGIPEERQRATLKETFHSGSSIFGVVDTRKARRRAVSRFVRYNLCFQRISNDIRATNTVEYTSRKLRHFSAERYEKFQQPFGRVNNNFPSNLEENSPIEVIKLPATFLSHFALNEKTMVSRKER